jgi:chromosome partitioning protein
MSDAVQETGQQQRQVQKPKIITIFNHKGGVGKTTLAFNLGIALAQFHNKRVLLVDLDPQANLTALALYNTNSNTFQNLYQPQGWTVYTALQPVIFRQGPVNVQSPHNLRTFPSGGVWLIPGDIRLAIFEAELPYAWTQCIAGQPGGFPVISALYELILDVANGQQCSHVLVDVGPNIGALNQTVMFASDYFIVPMCADLFSYLALDSLQRALKKWSGYWNQALSNAQNISAHLQQLRLPAGKPQFWGYFIMQFGRYGGGMAQAYQTWQNSIQSNIAQMLIQPLLQAGLAPSGANFHLGNIPNYRSLVPIAQNHNKAIFELGHPLVLGAHITMAQQAGQLFMNYAGKLP